ncbi:MAG: hypothetical protein HY328_11990 [Chloroflexi bacterium]|nr:hypothetical protein [Chloroflexota bacterium]
MGRSNGGDEDESAWVDVEELEEMELRIIAEKVWELLERDLLFDRERQGLGEQWGGWRQS